MKKLLSLAAVALALAASLGASPARAALDIGERAPDFAVPAALAGKQYRFSLAETLAKGPVVLYFFPAAFSVGCSAEAHEFAEAIDKFTALGATVIGISTDDIETQVKFSTQSCAGKFAVASDAGKTVVKSYDAAMMILPDYANRISYVIAPDSSIVYSYQSLNPSKHVEKTLAALKLWEKTKKPAVAPAEVDRNCRPIDRRHDPLFGGSTVRCRDLLLIFNNSLETPECASQSWRSPSLCLSLAPRRSRRSTLTLPFCSDRIRFPRPATRTASARPCWRSTTWPTR